MTAAIFPSAPKAWVQRARLVELLDQRAEAWDALSCAVALDRRLVVAAATAPAFAK